MRPRQRQWQQALRARWKAHGCCQWCGLPAEGFAYCFTHRVAVAASVQRWRDKQKRHEESTRVVRECSTRRPRTAATDRGKAMDFGA